jgi:hypothetical protein
MGVLVGSQDFAMHFLDEILSRNMAHINDLPLLQYIFFLPSYFFWRVLMGKLCRYVGTLWVQNHGSLFKAP